MEREQEGPKTRRFEDCSSKVIAACIEVHRIIGPGLLESAYEKCLAHELSLRGLSFERQKVLPVDYKGMRVECSYRIDFLIERDLIVELKAVEQLLPVHRTQLLTYLKLTGARTGLLVNFHSDVLRHGLQRLINPATFGPSVLPVNPAKSSRHR